MAAPKEKLPYGYRPAVVLAQFELHIPPALIPIEPTLRFGYATEAS
jgi:hypothetical protein